MSEPKSQSVVACLVDKDGLFLFVRESKPGKENIYNFPAGRVEGNELVTDAAVREVKEETGFDVELTGVVGFYQSIYEDVNVSGPVYLAVVVGGQLVTSEEHPEVIWASGEDIEKLDTEGKLGYRYVPKVMQDFKSRGIYPLNVVSAEDYRKNS